MDPDRSFERIYRRHRREVYGSVLRDVRDPDEAEEVTQVAFLNAYRAMCRGDEPEKPRAWLITIARNVVRRRARLRAERPQEVELDEGFLVSLDDMDGSAAEDICSALSRLTGAQREAIVLREIRGRSYAEIAEALSLSVPAVEALLFRARRTLAEELALVDRAPVVRPEKRHGILALPGLAKLGSFGFSFGRLGIACVVGCAVVATVPVGDRDASGEPAPAHAPRVQHVAARVPESRPAVRTKHATKPAKATRERTGKRRHHDSAPKGSGSADGTSADSGTLSVQLPAPLPEVQVPSVGVTPSVTVSPSGTGTPTVTVPPVQLPPPPDVSDVPLVSGLTS